MHKPAHVFTAVRFRAYALGVLLVAANNFWLMASATWASGYPTTVSLFHHVVFILFVVIGMSALGRALPGYRRAFVNPAEQVVLYAMLCVASGIGGLDLMQVLGTFTNGLRHLATPENDWDALFFRYVPDWLVVGDAGSIKALADGGTMVNVTLCFSPGQAILAAKAGASFISPFIGRLDDISVDGMKLIRDICRIYRNYDNFTTEVLVASIRHPMHVIDAAKTGAHVATMPPNVLRQLYKHPLTDSGLAAFLADWEKTGQSIL